MRLMIAGLMVWCAACGRDGLVREVVDAGPSLDAGRPDSGMAGDAGVTSAAVVLGTADEDVLAVAIAPTPRGFLLTWVESNAFRYRLMALAVDERGERTNLDQTLFELVSAAADRRASLLPFALRRVSTNRWRLTATVGDLVVGVNLDDDGFRQGPVREAPAPGVVWAVDGLNTTLLRDVNGGTSLLSPGGLQTPLPTTTNRGACVGAPSGAGFTLLTTSATGALALESLDPDTSRSWTLMPVARAPPTLTDPWAQPLALRSPDTGWLAAWAERTPANPRTVDLRIKRAGGATVAVAEEAAWYSTTADLVTTSAGWAVAWASTGVGWNDRMKFQREGGPRACDLLGGSGANHSAGPVAMTTRPDERIGVVWAQPQNVPSGQPRRAQLVFRSLGTSFCAP